MGRVKHPDTFTCDICGCDLDAWESNHVWPVLTICDEVANEYGAHKADSAEVNCVELFLCRGCLSEIVAVRRHPVFYGESTYELVERGE